jgi:hypothetical protein
MKGNARRFAFGIFLFGVSLQFQLQGLAVTVTNLNDSGPGSLRQAIVDTPVGATIDFAVIGTIVLTSGQLVITNDLTINGPGATKLTVSQNSNSRIFSVGNGDVSISGLTIANGNSSMEGGGIQNYATLVLKNCLIRSNFCVQAGGGIFNQGTLTIFDSLIISNTVYADIGGGILNVGTATIIGSAICGNNASPSFPGAGGIHNAGGGYLVVSKSTVSSNLRDGIVIWGGTTVISGSTLANNLGTDLAVDASQYSATIRNTIIKSCGGGTYTSEDYNLIQTDSIGFPSTFTGATNHNIYGQDPQLGPLVDNGGLTPTHALRFDSPAVDAGLSGGATTDQRGQPRPIDDPSIPNAGGGDGCDIGAYESDPILKIMNIAAMGADVRVGFNSVFGRNYRLESEGNLDNAWTTVSNNIAGTGSASQTVNAGTTNVPSQFYRVKLLP